MVNEIVQPEMLIIGPYHDTIDTTEANSLESITKMFCQQGAEAGLPIIDDCSSRREHTLTYRRCKHPQTFRSFFTNSISSSNNESVKSIISLLASLSRNSRTWW
ncbi:hypothetical protein KIN20_018913 [Parelaphostrongylus tenuis]|uniref:Uncharacterized protein n=1 Tax=Parelaphostrongylus tenuis TaxID=148309 RepID=A0AAD5N4S8_PARTN|nr:hypothetical protein KIN20_018913 [Parelaphostrongylus tenuis]